MKSMAQLPIQVLVVLVNKRYKYFILLETIIERSLFEVFIESPTTRPKSFNYGKTHIVHKYFFLLVNIKYNLLYYLCKRFVQEMHVHTRKLGTLLLLFIYIRLFRFLCLI